MKKEYRIKKSTEFEDILHTGKCVTKKQFVMYYKPASFGHDRIGISAGKRLGNAVERNKVKRQVRMMVQELWGDYSSGYDYIVIVRAAYHSYDFQTNKKELSALYQSVYNSKRRTN